MNASIANPTPKLNAAIVFLVLLQMAYACYEIREQRYGIASIAIYVAVIVALPGYIRGSKWAWAMLFLFSVYILHEAIFLYHNWYYSPDAYPRWLAVLQFAVSPLCLRVLGSGANSHSIDKQEFAKVFGSIPIAAGLIFIRGKYFSPFTCIEFSRPVKRWEYLVDYSGFGWWRTLLLLWCCYAGICIMTWVTARYISARSTQAHS
jgi:hypothetical protein